MRQFGLLLVVLGLVSIGLQVFNMNVRYLIWVDNWGTNVGWGIRAGLVVLGAILMVAGKPKSKG